MPKRSGIVERGRERGRSIVDLVEREFRDGRLDRGLSQDAVGDALGLDRSWISRVERGLVEDLSIGQAAELLSTVGLELSARVYPAGSPLRDAAHVTLLGRLRAVLHADLAWRTEVPLPIPGDLRAWDALIRGRGWRCGVEAETRPRDLQALERRLALKQRDGEVDCVMLLLGDTRHNRALLRSYADALHEQFPAPGRETLELLARGAPPTANSIVLL